MEDIQQSESDIDAHTDLILQAASLHNVQDLGQRTQVWAFPDCESVDVQNRHGTSPLHAAIASCGYKSSQNGDLAPIAVEESASNSAPEAENAACQTVRFLLENGAIWNQLDKNGETPGCLAYRLGLVDLYQIMVDAGVRAEILLNRLQGYAQLRDEDDEGDAPPEESAGLVGEETAVQIDVDPVDSATYLSSTVSFEDRKLLDGQQNGVMMAWEDSIMCRSADLILPTKGLRVLNIGFGMGIIDRYIAEEKGVTDHHIVEAHPAVLADMKAKGWNERPGVVIHAGKWQDILPGLVAQGLIFDAIFFDTFAESYANFRDFFSEQVIGLLDPSGRWSFFNGLGADRQLSYDVYQKVVEMDLHESGFDIEWEAIDTAVLSEEWAGVKRKYWNIDVYRLPVCRYMD